MHTLLLDACDDHDLKKAGEILQNGGLVGIPTETVYGLAANALNGECVKKIYTAKGRPSDNPLIVHVSKISDIEPLVKNIPEKGRKLAEYFWPAPLTIVFEKSDKIPPEISGGLDTVAIRIPESETARKIIDCANVPLAAPSANISGKPSPTSYTHVLADMNGKIDAIVKGEDCDVGVESTVISVVGETPVILRPGSVSREAIEKVIGKVKIARQLKKHEAPASPGMKYKHYSPKAEITISKLSFREFKKLVESDSDCTALCFEEQADKLNAKTVTYGKLYDSSSQAKALFSALHKLDEIGATKVYATSPIEKGVGTAVYNRLIRASHFRTIEPKVKIIGLSGKTGSGKSTVADIFKENGIAVIDCDKVTKQKETYTEKCLALLQNAFGEDLVIDGNLDRATLASRAFKTAEDTATLNKIVLPFIIERMEHIINELIQKGNTIIVLDAPTLFEANADELCTHIVITKASEDIRLDRIIKRDNLSEEQAKLRLNAGKPDDFYERAANYVINTDSGIEIDKINHIINTLKEK